jgi:hypothetical protein
LNSSVRYEVGHFCLEAALSALLAINASTETVGGANYYLRLQAELCHHDGWYFLNFFPAGPSIER